MALIVGALSKCRSCGKQIYYGPDATHDEKNEGYDYTKSRKDWRHKTTNLQRCHEPTPDVPYPPNAKPSTLCNEIQNDGRTICGRKIPPESLTESPPIYACGMHAKRVIADREALKMQKMMQEQNVEADAIRKWRWKQVEDLVAEMSEMLGLELSVPGFRDYGSLPTTVTIAIDDLEKLLRGVIAHAQSPDSTEGNIAEDDSVFV